VIQRILAFAMVGMAVSSLIAVLLAIFLGDYSFVRHAVFITTITCGVMAYVAEQMGR
jgi:hypothetical protein